MHVVIILRVDFKYEIIDFWTKKPDESVYG